MVKGTRVMSNKAVKSNKGAVKRTLQSSRIKVVRFLTQHKIGVVPTKHIYSRKGKSSPCLNKSTREYWANSIIGLITDNEEEKEEKNMLLSPKLRKILSKEETEEIDKHVSEIDKIGKKVKQYESDWNFTEEIYELRHIKNAILENEHTQEQLFFHAEWIIQQKIISQNKSAINHSIADFLRQKKEHRDGVKSRVQAANLLWKNNYE